MNDMIYGLHPVIEALEAGRTIDKILMRRGLVGDNMSQLLQLAREHRVPVQRVPPEKLDRVTRKNHQGVIALLAAVDYCRLSDVLPGLFEQGVNPLIVVLDGVTDVRNFGAIARTCDCAGVNALVIAERGSVTVGADAMKTSAGALNYVTVCREHNLAGALRYLRDSGVMVIATAGGTATVHTAADYTGPVAIVLGAEGEGISDEVLEVCNTRVAIPEFGHINSLNVSVAAGVVIYEAVRQRLADL